MVNPAKREYLSGSAAAHGAPSSSHRSMNSAPKESNPQKRTALTADVTGGATGARNHEHAHLPTGHVRMVHLLHREAEEFTSAVEKPVPPKSLFLEPHP
uniref:Uncharacterized protein n=1 Tax=Knipowitschia caucasica TaxID=637954 RepID=A0AAV2LH79_KNICA